MKKKLSTVLLIDDDEPTNFINSYIIQETNCAESIKAVQSAEEGLRYLSKSVPAPELIFLDINMPGLSGWDFLEEYKKLPQPQKTSIIVMLTTSLNPDDQVRARTIHEVSDFRSKNLSPEMLTELLQEHFPEIA
jgi:CheY-like chemotaxis protein